MSTILIGVVHDAVSGQDGGLMGQKSEKEFAESILRLLREETILVPEGGKFPGVVAKGHPLYEGFLNDICPTLSRSGKTPRLIWNDALAGRRNGKQWKALGAIMNFQERCRTLFLMKDMPTTLNGVIDALSEPQRFIQLAFKPSQIDRDLAANVLGNNTKRNKSFIEAIRRAETLSEHVFFIGGAAHALELHRAHQWDLKVLGKYENDPAGFAALMFWGTVTLNYCPRIILSAR